MKCLKRTCPSRSLTRGPDFCRQATKCHFTSRQHISVQCLGKDYMSEKGGHSHPESDSNEVSFGRAGVESSSAEQDWRAFRAQLVRMEQAASPTFSPTSPMWAHSIPNPEKGCVLVSHPSMFTTSQTYFYQAVILILEHDNAVGTWGIILNRASEYTLRQAAQCEVPEALSGLLDVHLYVGGDVGKGTMLLHSDPDLEGSVEVIRGVYVGGEEAASIAVKNGQKKPEDFRWFMRYAGWGPGQLQQECSSGVWFTAAASPELIQWRPPLSEGKQLWYKVLELMGGDYGVLAQRVKEAWGSLSTRAQAEPDEAGKKPPPTDA